MPRRHPCLNCLCRAGVELKLDKKSRPYSYCSVCGTRAFIKSRAGLRGLMILAPQVLALWQSAGSATETLDKADNEAANALATGGLIAADDGGF